MRLVQEWRLRNHFQSSQLVPKDLIGETQCRAAESNLRHQSQLVPKDLIGETAVLRPGQHTAS